MKKSFILSTSAIVIVLVGLNNAYLFQLQRNGRLPLTIWQFTLMFVTMIALVSVIMLIHDLIKSREKYLKKLQMKYIDEVKQMMTSIRGERHDLLNHLNTVYALTSLKQYDELNRYTKELVDDATITNDLIQVGHPAIAALLYCKMISAQQQNTSFTYSCENLEQFPVSLRSLDIVRLIGNMLDNALDAVSDLPVDRRQVHIHIWVNSHKLHITVTNSGHISQEWVNNIFEPGFSTKNRHSGLGLSIVKQLVNKYKGSIHLDLMQPGMVTFDVQIGLNSIN